MGLTRKTLYGRLMKDIDMKKLIQFFLPVILKTLVSIIIQPFNR
jgi:hypothetical protein